MTERIIGIAWTDEGRQIAAEELRMQLLEEGTSVEYINQAIPHELIHAQAHGGLGVFVLKKENGDLIPQYRLLTPYTPTDIVVTALAPGPDDMSITDWNWVNDNIPDVDIGEVERRLTEIWGKPFLETLQNFVNNNKSGQFEVDFG
jgi:hypothetical protein